MVRRLGFPGTLLAIVALAWIATQQLPHLGQAHPASIPTVLPSPSAAPTPSPTIPSPSLTLVPPSGPLVPGATFDVQVLLNSPVVTRAAQFGLSFDPNMLAVTGIAEGDYYRIWAQAHQASTIVAPGFQVDAQNGWVGPFGITLVGGLPRAGPSGLGRMATIHLQAKPGVSGISTLKFEDVTIVLIGTNEIGMSFSSVQVTDAVLAVGSGASGALVKTPTPHLGVAQIAGPAPAGYSWPTPTPPPGFRVPGPQLTPTSSPAQIRQMPGAPEVQTLPASCPPSVATGVVVARDPQRIPPLLTRMVQVTTIAGLTWHNWWYIVEAGSAIGDPTTGMMLVYREAADVCPHPPRHDSDEDIGYPAPEHHGALTMTQVDGDSILFTTADGSSGRFNVTTGQFSSK